MLNRLPHTNGNSSRPGLMASRFVELRQELLRPCHLVVGVVDIDASSLAARCAPRRLGRHRLGIFISPLSSHTTAAASALTSPLSVPGAGSNGGSNAFQIDAVPGRAERIRPVQRHPSPRWAQEGSNRPARVCAGRSHRGTGGIRTPGPCGPPAFKAGAFVRSATVPLRRLPMAGSAATATLRPFPWRGAGAAERGALLRR